MKLSPAGYASALQELKRFRERLWRGYEATREGRRGQYLHDQGRNIARMARLTGRVIETEDARRAEKAAAA